MHICDWRDLDSELAQLQAKMERDEKVCPPFALLALSSSLSLQRKSAEIWAHESDGVKNELGPLTRRSRPDRIRIGYFSSDFQQHAPAYLIAGLLERHDRSQFEIIAFSFGPSSNDGMRQRLQAACDQFLEVGHLSDVAIAALSRHWEVDIAVDLKGFTQGSRPAIFAARAAAIQVNYLGYPGTMGADFIDYLIADNTVVPREKRPHYAEKIVTLPGSNQVNDDQRWIADTTFTRAELGLPQTGFVFCCFNNNYKITPATFDLWMRILQQVDESVLWLVQDSADAAENLRREASARAVDARRLVFARRMPQAEHLARHRLADLFLDTFPCNAHTTGSDALWAGLPVLTCSTEAFAGRVAASLLKAVDLPELIYSSPQTYEAIALRLARDRAQLQAMRQRLAQDRWKAPLFNTSLYTRRIEAAYVQMMHRHHDGLPADHILIPNEQAM
jgi:predicted O-linked N-acetylglucosamine transferase (SPINDLY family)